jgi:SAM-dependent methyltransferase
MNKEKLYRLFGSTEVSWNERLALHLSDSVVDIGCGTGNVLAKVDAEVHVGLDITRQKLISNKGGKAEFVFGDACTLPFQSRCFDVVMTRQAVSHIWKLDECLSEMRRVSKRIFYVEDSNLLNPVVLAGLLFRFGPQWLFSKSRVYRGDSLAEFGKREDVHSVFWWRRKLGKVEVLGRRRFANPLLDWLWRFFGPDAILRMEVN